MNPDTAKEIVSTKTRASAAEKTLTRGRNEFDEPTKTEETNAQNNESTNERDRYGNLWAIPDCAVIFFDVFDDIGNCERHDSDWTDGDILGRSEEL